MARIEWLTTEGGPHVVLPTAVLKHWRGTDGKDYEKACELGDDYVATVKVKGKTGLVLGDDSVATCWFPGLPGPAGSFVRARMGDDDDTILRHLKKLPQDWETVATIEVAKGGLVMFDSAWPGAEVEESQSIDVPAGNYVVKRQVYSPARHELELIWLSPSE